MVVLDSNLNFKQKFSQVGYRPHKTIYDPVTQAFYVIAAPTVFCFKKAGGILYLAYQKSLPSLQNSYVRSIQIIDGAMYFVSGTNKIVVANHADESFDVIKEIAVPNELSGMNDIYKIADYYYLTSTQNSTGAIAPKCIRIKDLDQLASHQYEDLYDVLGFAGTPYFLEVFDGRIFITEIGDVSRIISFTTDSLVYKTHFSFIGANDADIKRSDMYAK
ncbi:hypothetical protein [Paenibacillus sp. FSL L8-0158]|uniref:hypothetical protein n=1 Tax=Paenibacillus sp. FSL L8-0158 TaxID=2954752 RepID=UPI003158E3D6